MLAGWFCSMAVRWQCRRSLTGELVVVQVGGLQRGQLAQAGQRAGQVVGVQRQLLEEWQLQVRHAASQLVLRQLNLRTQQKGEVGSASG